MRARNVAGKFIVILDLEKQLDRQEPFPERDAWRRETPRQPRPLLVAEGSRRATQEPGEGVGVWRPEQVLGDQRVEIEDGPIRWYSDLGGPEETRREFVECGRRWQCRPSG